jgi:hypothetical protein
MGQGHETCKFQDKHIYIEHIFGMKKVHVYWSWQEVHVHVA